MRTDWFKIERQLFSNLIMPQITVQGKTFTCDRGENLRKVLLNNKIDLYNGNAKVINCHGIGTCGTCSVDIEGEISAPNWREKSRLSLPPHHPNTSRRLACQVQVLGDIKIKKYTGFWGQEEALKWT